MRPRRPAAPIRALLTVSAALLVVGCSADVAREQPLYTSSLPPPRPPLGMAHDASPAYAETGSLGGPERAYDPRAPRYRSSDAARPIGPVEPAPPVENPQPMRWHARRGYVPGSYMIEVQDGDTLYGLSRRHGVAVADLVAANRLTSGRIEIGQRLLVPAAPR